MAYETDKFAFGKLPSDWRCVPLGDLIKSTEYGSSAKSHYSGTIPVLRMGNLQEGKIDWGDLVYTSDESEIKRYRLRNGDVLFNRTNTVDLVGKAAIYKGSRPAIFAGYLIRIIHNETLVDSNYLNYVLNTYQAKKYSKAVLSVAVSQANINAEKLKTYPIPLPPTLEEQTAIANALSDVDDLISELEKLIAKKQAIKTATMQQLLTGKKRLPEFAKNEDGTKKGYKKSELGDIPEDWQSLSLGSDAVLKARIGWQALTTKEYQISGDFFLVTGTDFDAGLVKWERCFHVSEWRYKQDTNIQLKEGDVLVTKDGTIGKVGYVPKLTKPATLNSGVFVIRPKRESFEPRFLFYILTSRLFDDFITRITAGSTITHLYQKDFVNFEFFAPEKSEQIAIATILSDMDSDIQALEQRLSKTRQIKQGMMQELLTGKTRLVKPESK